MTNEREPTYRELKLFRLMLADVRKEHAGADLMDETGIPSGNLYPILSRLLQAGILEDRWEEIDPRVEGRPKRRFYRLSAHGIGVAQRALGPVSTPSKMLKPDWGRS